MKYIAKLEVEDKGGFSVSFPDLPGCFSEGDSLEEAITMATKALDALLGFYLDHNRDIPPPLSYQGNGYYEIDVDPVIATAVLIRTQRGRRPMSEIAELIGTTPQNYFRYERAGCNPTLKTLSRIAKACGKKLEVRFI